MDGRPVYVLPPMIDCIYKVKKMKMTKDELKKAWKSYAIDFEFSTDEVAIIEASVLLPTQIDGQTAWYQLNDEELDYINDEFYSEIDSCWHEYWSEKCS